MPLNAVAGAKSHRPWILQPTNFYKFLGNTFMKKLTFFYSNHEHVSN